MGTRLYPLPGEDEDGTKVWYPLGLGMGMGIDFFYGDGYGIVKPVPAPLPSLPVSRGGKRVSPTHFGPARLWPVKKWVGPDWPVK